MNISKVIPPDQFTVYSLEDAVVLEMKDGKYSDMMCDVCGVVCRRRIKRLPDYVAYRLKKRCCDVVQYLNGVAYLEILPTLDYGINPPISESFRVASNNVIAICRAFTGKHSLELNHKINALAQAMLFASKKRNEYVSDLNEFELALAHTVMFAPDVMNSIDFKALDGHGQHTAETIVDVAGPFIDTVIAKHRRIRGAFKDLGLPLRERTVCQIVYSLNEKNTRSQYQDKVKDVCDDFLFQRVIPFHKYSSFSDKVVGAAIYSLACIYAGVGEPQIETLARQLEVLPGGINSVRVQMGEDISMTEKK